MIDFIYVKCIILLRRFNKLDTFVFLVQVVSMDLSSNKLPTLDHFTSLHAPNLKSINLEDNRLEIGQLEKLSSLKLVSLVKSI